MAEMMIRRLGVFSVAKIQGLLTLVVGLIIGVIYGLLLMIFGVAMATIIPGRDNQAIGGISSVVLGLVIMILFPLFYGVIGFVAGAIAAIIYNTVAGVVGGVKIELETTTPQYSPPSPPQWG